MSRAPTSTFVKKSRVVGLIVWPLKIITKKNSKNKSPYFTWHTHGTQQVMPSSFVTTCLKCTISKTCTRRKVANKRHSIQFFVNLLFFRLRKFFLFCLLLWRRNRVLRWMMFWSYSHSPCFYYEKNKTKYNSSSCIWFIENWPWEHSAQKCLASLNYYFHKPAGGCPAFNSLSLSFGGEDMAN